MSTGSIIGGIIGAVVGFYTVGVSAGAAVGTSIGQEADPEEFDGDAAPRKRSINREVPDEPAELLRRE